MIVLCTTVTQNTDQQSGIFYIRGATEAGLAGLTITNGDHYYFGGEIDNYGFSSLDAFWTEYIPSSMTTY